jgi:hypothetical protein
MYGILRSNTVFTFSRMYNLARIVHLLKTISMSHVIPLSTAKQMIDKYNQERNSILEPAYKGQDVLAICETFDRADIDAVLRQRDCVAIRIYYGMDTQSKVHAIIVGVNSNNEDIVPSNGTATSTIASSGISGGSGSEGVNEALDEEIGLILENGQRCPTNCPPSSYLTR